MDCRSFALFAVPSTPWRYISFLASPLTLLCRTLEEWQAPPFVEYRKWAQGGVRSLISCFLTGISLYWICQELGEIRKAPIKNIEVEVDESNVTHWDVKLRGPVSRLLHALRITSAILSGLCSPERHALSGRDLQALYRFHQWLSIQATYRQLFRENISPLTIWET